MPGEEVQTTASFVGQHPGITVAFVGVLLGVIVYLWIRLENTKERNAKSVIDGLHAALEKQKETLDTTLDKLSETVGKLEKTITDLAAELFRDMKNLDRRLSKLDGEHEAIHLRTRRAKDKEDC